VRNSSPELITLMLTTSWNMLYVLTSELSNFDLKQDNNTIMNLIHIILQWKQPNSIINGKLNYAHVMNWSPTWASMTADPNNAWISCIINNFFPLLCCYWINLHLLQKGTYYGCYLHLRTLATLEYSWEVFYYIVTQISKNFNICCVVGFLAYLEPF
jgi:hypothetical protein